MEPEKVSFWTSFGAGMDPAPRQKENWTKNGTEIGTTSGEQKWGCKVQIMSDAGAGAGTNHVR